MALFQRDTVTATSPLKALTTILFSGEPSFLWIYNLNEHLGLAEEVYFSRFTWALMTWSESICRLLCTCSEMHMALDSLNTAQTVIDVKAKSLRWNTWPPPIGLNRPLMSSFQYFHIRLSFPEGSLCLIRMQSLSVCVRERIKLSWLQTIYFLCMCLSGYVPVGCRHMLNVTWERKDLSFNSQGFLSNPSMIIIALDRERLWDKVLATNHTMPLKSQVHLEKCLKTPEIHFHVLFWKHVLHYLVKLYYILASSSSFSKFHKQISLDTETEESFNLFFSSHLWTDLETSDILAIMF